MQMAYIGTKKSRDGFENPKYEYLLKPIIKEEIDQRQRFILCRSENTKESAWVKFEEDYIKSKNSMDTPLA